MPVRLCVLFVKNCTCVGQGDHWCRIPSPPPAPLAGTTPKPQKVVETTPTVALTRVLLSQRAIEQRIQSSHIPPCHRHMVIATNLTSLCDLLHCSIPQARTECCLEFTAVGGYRMFLVLSGGGGGVVCKVHLVCLWGRQGRRIKRPNGSTHDSHYLEPNTNLKLTDATRIV